MQLLGIPVDEVVDRWRDEAAALRDGAAVAAPFGTPEIELRRSPVAARIGAHAAASGLGHFHYEHRVPLPLPTAWVPDEAPDLTEAPAWEAGVLPEPKYASFRHDLLLGSYHPHHRAKWSAHELCHALVGFAWDPAFTPFANATAGRLAELLPVAVWYFLDEVFVRRCPDHHGGGALYRLLCPRCEAMALADPDPTGAAERIADGLRFVDRELAAIARSRRLGRPVPHRHATLDLSSDGVAYAHAHSPRLADPRWHAFAEHHLVDGGGWSSTLDALEARVLEVLRALTTDAPLRAWAPSADHGRARWSAQDLAWRHVHAHAIGAAPAPEGTPWADVVAASTDPEAAPLVQLGATVLAQRAAFLAAGVPPEAVFATGVALPQAPAVATPHLREGLRSALPLAVELVDDATPDALDAFAHHDLAHPERRALPDRFVAWARATWPAGLPDLAAWEAVACTRPAVPEVVLPGPPLDARRRLRADVAVLRAAVDLFDVAHGADVGALRLGPDGHLVDEAGAVPEAVDVALLVGREPDGGLLVLDVDPATAAALSALSVDGAVPELPDDEVADLEAHGVLVPVAWAEHAP